MDEPFDVEPDHVRVRNMTFDQDEGLQENGEDFVEDLVDALSMPELDI